MPSANKSRRGMPLLFIALTAASSASAWCPAPEAKVCSAYFMSEKVFYGRVAKVTPAGDNGLGGAESYRYTVEVETPLKGKVGRVEIVETENSTTRWLARRWRTSRRVCPEGYDLGMVQSHR